MKIAVAAFASALSLGALTNMALAHPTSPVRPQAEQIDTFSQARDIQNFGGYAGARSLDPSNEYGVSPGVYYSVPTELGGGRETTHNRFGG